MEELFGLPGKALGKGSFTCNIPSACLVLSLVPSLFRIDPDAPAMVEGFRSAAGYFPA